MSSSELFENLPDRSPMQRTWAAVIASNPSDFADLVSVTIPGLDANLRWEDCKWQARNDVDFPQRGNTCLVIFDDNMQLWVVAWWPF